MPKRITWITEALGVGADYGRGPDDAVLAEEGVQQLLCVRSHAPGPASLHTPIWIPIVDRRPVPYATFVAAMAVLDLWHRLGRSMVVYCHEGKSRSPTIVALHLAWSGLCHDLPAALEWVKREIPEMDSVPEPLASAYAFVQSPECRLASHRTWPKGDLGGSCR